MRTPGMLDQVQWQEQIDKDGRRVWRNFGAERPCNVRVIRQQDTEETLQERNAPTHRIVQWYQSGLSPNNHRAVVRESNGREPYTLDLIRFEPADNRRLMLRLDCRLIAPGNPKT